MDATEQLVEAYLRRAGFTDIVYETDGNIPPDFLVNNRIAIEARRLNQNYDAGTGRGARGLEEDAIPLWHQMTSYLTALGPPGPSETSWYVLYRFGRPVIWKDIKRELDRVLKPFLNCPDPQAFNKVLSDRFSIRVFKSPFPKDTCFRAAGHSDEQSGGWLMSMMDENLHHCVLEKSRKIARHRAKYSEW